MQCPACHNDVPPAAFCSLCGAPLSASAPPPAAGYTVPPPAMGASTINPNMAAAISYLTFIPAVLFLLIEPYNKTPFVRFHSYQSIGLFVVGLGVDVVLKLIPFGMMWTLSSLISLAFFVVWLIVVIKASQGEWFKLPIIGDFALKQSQS